MTSADQWAKAAGDLAAVSGCSFREANDALQSTCGLVQRAEAGDRLVAWVSEERGLLWSWFGHASDRALRTPDPRDPEHWSIEMLGFAEQIKSAGGLLGGPTPWGEVTWSNWPFYEGVEGVPLPAEAWAWLDNWLEKEGHKPQSSGWDRSARWALQYRPVSRL